MTPFVAELLGTFLLILFGAGVCANVSLQKTYAHQSGWIVIALGWAIGVFVGVFVAGTISGAHLNPAVTLGLAVAGTFPWANVPFYILTQVFKTFFKTPFRIPFRMFCLKPSEPLLWFSLFFICPVQR